MSIYSFYVVKLRCGHEQKREDEVYKNDIIFCTNCRTVKQVTSVELHQQPIDDIEEMPE